MRIDGEWFECDDAIVRPVVRGEVLHAHGHWEPAPFLVDTGADCTVFRAAILDVLGFTAAPSGQRLGGVGGVVDSVEVTTQIRLPHDAGRTAVFRGEYAAFTQLEALDMCLLGRDILEFFAVIVDRPAETVTLLRESHRYTIETARQPPA
jgi:hypothetical protein